MQTSKRSLHLKTAQIREATHNSKVQLLLDGILSPRPKAQASGRHPTARRNRRPREPSPETGLRSFAGKQLGLGFRVYIGFRV